VKLDIQQSSVYLKIYYFYELKNDTSFFIQLSNKLRHFPLNSSYDKIIGLNLSGEHYYRNVSFQEIQKVSLEEIMQIKRIKPIMNKSDHLPYIIDRDYFEICIPAKGQSVQQLTACITKMDDFFSSLTENVQWKKVEIHIKGAWEKYLLDRITQSLSGFSKNIEVIREGKQTDETLAYFLMNKDQFYDISGVKLIDRNSEIIMKAIAKMKLGLSIYSDQVNWFIKILETLAKSDLFEAQIPTEKYLALPHMAEF